MVQDEIPLILDVGCGDCFDRADIEADDTMPYWI